MTNNSKAIWVLVALWAVSAVDGYAVTQAQQVQALQRELRYYKRAAVIVDLLHKEHARVDMATVVLTLKEIDKNLVKYFPHGPFTQEDFIGLAMQESRFDMKCPGSSGEKGIFQIMPYYKHKGNLAAIPINTELAFRIMRAKYREHHNDYRRAIIGYNGYNIRNGVLVDTYWRQFRRQRARVCLALGIPAQKPVVDKNSAIAQKLEMDVYGSKKGA